VLTHEVAEGGFTHGEGTPNVDQNRLCDRSWQMSDGDDKAQVRNQICISKVALDDLVREITGSQIPQTSRPFPHKMEQSGLPVVEMDVTSPSHYS
jgi:hypothetical protein